jgi:hypothetical protein
MAERPEKNSDEIQHRFESRLKILLSTEEIDSLLKQARESKTPENLGQILIAIRFLHVTRLQTAVDLAWEVFHYQRKLSHRNRKSDPEIIRRDTEIIRLRDKEKKTFGEIGRLLLVKNPAWSGKEGKPLSRAAVEKAYHRRKDRTDK